MIALLIVYFFFLIQICVLNPQSCAVRNIQEFVDLEHSVYFYVTKVTVLLTVTVHNGHTPAIYTSTEHVERT